MNETAYRYYEWKSVPDKGGWTLLYVFAAAPTTPKGKERFLYRVAINNKLKTMSIDENYFPLTKLKKANLVSITRTKWRQRIVEAIWWKEEGEGGGGHETKI